LTLSCESNSIAVAVIAVADRGELPHVGTRSNWRGILKILCFAKRHWLLILCTLGAMAAYATCEGAFILLMRPFVDAFASKGKETGELAENAGNLYRIGKLALLLAPCIALGALAQNYLRGLVTWRLVVDIRNAVCAAIMPQSLSYFEDRRSGDLMSRITNDVMRSEGAFSQLFGGIPEHVSHVIMGVTLAAITSWQVLAIGLFAIPLVIAPISYLARKIRLYGRQGLEKLSDLTDLMAQMFSGIRVIKAFKMEDAELNEFRRTNRKLLGKMMKMVRARALSAGTVELVVRAFIGAAVLLAVWLMAREVLTIKPGSMMVCIGGMYYAFNAAKRLVKSYNRLQECVPAADRIMEIIETTPTLLDAPDAVALARIEQGIAFRDVSFAYNTEPVLQNVTFEVRRGETVALVGRSGAGKSTLIALACRFYDVTAGAVEIDGIDVRKIRRDSLLDRIAIVSQQTFLFNRSIGENIRYGRRDASMAEVEAAARAAHIHDFIQSLPEGYDTLCGEFGAKLSGGQRQRMAIARALLKNADILILDEAMAGLDAESESQVRAALEALMQGRTTFIITHDLPMIRNADRIFVVENGRLAGQGTHEQLMAEVAEYRTLYNLQFSAPSSPPPENDR